MGRVSETARSAAGPAAKANSKATYPSGISPEDKARQQAAHTGGSISEGSGPKTPEDCNKKHDCP